MPERGVLSDMDISHTSITLSRGCCPPLVSCTSMAEGCELTAAPTCASRLEPPPLQPPSFELPEWDKSRSASTASEGGTATFLCTLPPTATADAGTADATADGWVIETEAGAGA